MTDTLMVSVSGVRGIVGKDLTDDVVSRWAHAFGAWIVAARDGERRGGGATVVIGRDARTSGPAFARAAIAGLAAAGCDVIDVGLVPTPTVQLAVEHHRAGGGIVITASHNPIEWNALKFIGPDGIFLDGAAGARVQTLMVEGGAGRGRAGKVTMDEGAIERHLDAVLQLSAVDVDRTRRRRFKVALDAVRGAGGPVVRTLLRRVACTGTGINLGNGGQFPPGPRSGQHPAAIPSPSQVASPLLPLKKKKM